MKDQSAGKPRYRHLAETLIERVERGVYPVGSSLPSEQELCSEFGVSRFTIREALRLLSSRRYLRRRQGSGSEVISADPRGGYHLGVRSLSELFGYGADTRLTLENIRIVEADAELAAFLGRPPGRSWLISEGVRRARDGDPINFSRIYLHEDYLAAAPDLPGLSAPVHRMLEARYGANIVEVTRKIAAEPFPADAGAALGAAPGAMAIRVTGRYLDDADRPLIVSIDWHPAERFTYFMRFKRDDAEES
ncbi:GntR family transcriptional regulator [Pikeienuella piscinae]|uniref:GntR family transcriptional regulator n=1 Tax=Pikeienuella piscinae TaxID=2748098 RepID=A0A7M3T5H4_9RHOB|nr:GntR family transcriptional regulator [Pikeienuella piscinae]QIE57255.1 GntR family transcriptional regulator [Pikeienuella piscinae]